jgi:single-strand DNA-binding protein
VAGVNKAIIVGNLGQDPELRHTQAGQAVCELSVATSRKYKDNEETTWHRIVVWGKQAEACAEYLKKGRQVYVEGRLQTRSWNDKDGNKRWITEIVAEQVQFLGGGNAKRSQRQDSPPAGGYDDDLPF